MQLPACLPACLIRLAAVCYLVGTSIWEMQNLAQMMTMAQSSVGMSGTSSSRMLLGRCVTT